MTSSVNMGGDADFKISGVGSGTTGNELVGALCKLVQQMRALETSRRIAEQCFTDYASHYIKLILNQDSKQDKVYSVGNLETKLSAMQALLREVDSEKSKVNNVVETIDSHLKMIARRTSERVNSTCMKEDGVAATNGSNSGALVVNRNLATGVGKSTKSNSKKSNVEQPSVTVGIGTTMEVVPGFSSSFDQSAESTNQSNNEAFSLDKHNSVLTATANQPTLRKVNKAAKKNRRTDPMLEEASPRTLFQVLLSLEREYDALEKEMFDCIDLLQCSTASRQAAKKLKERERSLRHLLDRKAVQIDRVLNVLEATLHHKAKVCNQNNEFTKTLSNKSTQKSFKSSVFEKSSDLVCDVSSKNKVWGFISRPFAIEAQDYTLRKKQKAPSIKFENLKMSLVGVATPKSRNNNRRCRFKLNKHASKEAFNVERYHNVKLLREMKEFNRFLTSTASGGF